MIIEPRIEFIYPGSLFSEESSAVIDHRDPARVKIEDGAFAFRFYDLKTLAGTLEDGSPISKSERINISKTYYPGGEVFTADDVARLEPKEDYRILLSNMRGNGYGLVVRTRRGNFQPFDEKNDSLV